MIMRNIETMRRLTFPGYAIHEMMDKEDGDYLIMSNNGIVMVMLTLDERTVSTVVSSLEVEEKERGKGLGSRFMKDIEGIVLTPTIRVYVDEGGPIDFYKKLGYEEKDVSYMDGVGNITLMVKDLVSNGMDRFREYSEIPF